MKIIKQDPVTGKLNTIDIPLEGHEKAYVKWLRREGLIQNMLPHLTADQREFLMTGITPESWKKYLEMQNEDPRSTSVWVSY